jgi:hypothetical protein
MNFDKVKAEPAVDLGRLPAFRAVRDCEITSATAVSVL